MLRSAVRGSSRSRACTKLLDGTVSERPKVQLSKSCVGVEPTVGSNPTGSALSCLRTKETLEPICSGVSCFFDLVPERLIARDTNAVYVRAVATYKAVMLTKRGGPEVLEVVDVPVVDPAPGEVRVRVLACGVGATDITMRRGYYPYAPKIPFVPGYDVVGVVDAVGAGVTTLRVGDTVCALTVHGGYAEFVVRDARDFMVIPDGLDHAAVVALILNYVTAYQMIHRVARQAPGETALVTGANGGVGQALLELLALAGVTAFGAASAHHHDLVRSFGATPIESREGSIDGNLRALVPDGVDVVYDALGGRYVAPSLRATRRGGRVVGYGFAGTTGRNGGPSNLKVTRGFSDLFVRGPVTGRRASFYGITALYRKNRTPFFEDLRILIDLLADGRLNPVIAARLDLLDARTGNELIEAGGVNGKIVLVRAHGATA